MSKLKRLIRDNYRLDNAVKELCSALRLYKLNHDYQTTFILMDLESKDYIFASNGSKMNITTPIVISRLEIMIKRLKEAK